MTFYIKKPIAVEAWQFDGTLKSIQPALDHLGSDNCGYADVHGNLYLQCGADRVTASRGDWIIKGVAGEFYPCPKAVFEASYEPAPEPENPTHKASPFFTLNGRKLEAKGQALTYENFVALAFKNPQPGAVYSATYSRPHRVGRSGGWINLGQTIEISPGLIINICITGAA